MTDWVNYQIVDVFTSTPFNGAQIAVISDADELTDSQMNDIARELNLSETVFLTRPQLAGASSRMRTFTRNGEVAFGGHPTIAAGFVLASSGSVEIPERGIDIVIEQTAGPVDVTLKRLDDGGVFTQFTLKTRPMVDRFVPMESQLAAMLGLTERDIDKDKYHSLMVATDRSYLIIPLRSFAAVRAAKFDEAYWNQHIAPLTMAREILLFSTRSDTPVANFHGRLVGPDVAPGEDPPIGSASPAFAGYLCAHTHVSAGTHAFVIDRGVVDARKSLLTIEMVNNASRDLEVRVAGPAVMSATGRIRYR
ncbi:MAG: PhzF family phenazine biosynthesis protein [Gammaproteobacteria bacterium]|nr:PhzF family phenazine biosynthesis protein [Gammaproteobacteria bacterium]